MQALFLASCLLSVVSFYTTQQGMALYLSPWFSILAALGIQVSLVMVAWLIGFTRRSRALLIVVYIVTGVVSVAFSYVCLYTWFQAKERPAQMQRALYDELIVTAAKTEQVLSEGVSKGHSYVTALEEMTAAERAHGHISRARDTDAYLDRIREAVAREAQSYDSRYREGSGEGIRYTAFERHTRLTRQTTAEIEAARGAIQRVKAELKPNMSSEEQLRRFRQAFDPVPWAAIESVLQRPQIQRPTLPTYAGFVEQPGSGQEDLLRAFDELFTAPNSRHAFALALAAFIDLIVFLLAYSSGPYFYGDPEQRWVQASAALDSADYQVFLQGLLRKMRPGRQGMPRADAADLSPGEQQLCLLLVAKGLAVADDDDGAAHYLFDAAVHEKMLDALADPGLPLRAGQRAAAGA